MKRREFITSVTRVPQQLAGGHDVLRRLLNQQRLGHALDGDAQARRGLSRGDQSPSFRFREQPPM